MTGPLPLGPFPDAAGYADAVQADLADPLARFRDHFAPTEPDLIYLDGNSLGRLPSATVDHLRRVVDHEWGRALIRSWGERWWDLAREVGDSIAPLIGAPAGSVVAADSTTVGLFKLAWGALQERPGRSEIVTDDMNFPTDVYVLGAAGRAAGGATVTIIESADGVEGPEEAILEAITPATALVSLSHVSFKSAYLYDMARITAAARAAGALVLWDLSHSVGVVPMDLGMADMAVGCTYKYLNGGPGAPAFVYVNPALEVDNPLHGWWGHESPFSFDLEYAAADSIARFQTGTMPILSLSAIEPAVALVAEAGVPAIRAKSVALTDYLIALADEVLGPLGFTVASPRSSARRGSHVSLRHDDAWRITQAMTDVGRVVPDFRDPDNIRLGLAPLYTSFLDVHTAVHRMATLMNDDLLNRYPEARGAVT
ncbi:MAG: kynureninase [Acidimicrobiia bacterium]|nr:kynureninase [Acidimicrobiia bacterium]